MDLVKMFLFPPVDKRIVISERPSRVPGGKPQKRIELVRTARRHVPVSSEVAVRRTRVLEDERGLPLRQRGAVPRRNTLPAYIEEERLPPGRHHPRPSNLRRMTMPPRAGHQPQHPDARYVNMHLERERARQEDIAFDQRMGEREDEAEYFEETDEDELYLSDTGEELGRHHHSIAASGSDLGRRRAYRGESMLHMDGYHSDDDLYHQRREPRRLLPAPRGLMDDDFIDLTAGHRRQRRYSPLSNLFRFGRGRREDLEPVPMARGAVRRNGTFASNEGRRVRDYDVEREIEATMAREERERERRKRDEPW